jgi:hypothetical protein
MKKFRKLANRPVEERFAKIKEEVVKDGMGWTPYCDMLLRQILLLEQQVEGHHEEIKDIYEKLDEKAEMYDN